MILSSKLMEEKKRTSPKYTAWKEKLINMPCFSQSKTGQTKAWKEINLSSAPGIPHRVPGYGFFWQIVFHLWQRSTRNFRQRRYSSIFARRAGHRIFGPGTLHCFNTKLKYRWRLLPSTPPLIPDSAQHSLGSWAIHLHKYLGFEGEDCPSRLCISHTEQGAWYVRSWLSVIIFEYVSEWENEVHKQGTKGSKNPCPLFRSLGKTNLWFCLGCQGFFQIYWMPTYFQSS